MTPQAHSGQSPTPDKPPIFGSVEGVGENVYAFTRAVSRSGAHVRERAALVVGMTNQNTRVRPEGGLAVQTVTLPAAEWEAWMAKTERFLVVALTEAMNLYERAPVQNDSHLFFAADAAN